MSSPFLGTYGCVKTSIIFLIYQISVIRREAWSADGHDRYVQFNRRNILTLDPKPHLQDNYSTRSEKMHRHHQHQQPNVIYTREMQQHDQQHQNHNHHQHGVQMMEEALVHLDTPTALDLERPNIVPRSNNFSTEVLLEEADEEDSSVRRHEAERGSDIVHRIIPSSKTGVVEVLTLPDDDRVSPYC
jgi:hypothetical protein